MAQLNGLGRDEMHVIAMVLAGGQGSRLLPLTSGSREARGSLGGV